MKKRICALSVLMAAIMGLSMVGCSAPDTDAAIENTEKVAFTATPSQKKIIVEMESGKQELALAFNKIDKDLYDPTMMIVEDYNFDGYKDIAFPANYNEHNTIYQLWLYNAETGKFEEYTSFGEYYNPTIDAEHQKINTICYQNQASTSTAVYEWRDGEMLCLELNIESKEDGETVKTKWAYNETSGQLEPVAETEKEESSQEE